MKLTFYPYLNIYISKLFAFQLKTIVKVVDADTWAERSSGQMQMQWVAAVDGQKRGKVAAGVRWGQWD